MPYIYMQIHIYKMYICKYLHLKNLTICQARYHCYCGSQAREGCKLDQSEVVEVVHLLSHTCILHHPCTTPNKYIEVNFCHHFHLATLSSKFSIQVKSSVPNQRITQDCSLHQQNMKTTHSSMNSEIRIGHFSLS